jgi:hypothetical protein
LLVKFNKSWNLLHEKMHENLTTFPTPHTSSNNIASPKYYKLNKLHGTHFNIAMKNLPPSSNTECCWKHRNQPIMHNMQQTKSNKKVKRIAPIITRSCHTYLHSPSNMNDEIQKVGKFKQHSRCGWFTHTSTLISCHINF